MKYKLLESTYTFENKTCWEFQWKPVRQLSSLDEIDILNNEVERWCIDNLLYHGYDHYMRCGSGGPVIYSYDEEATAAIKLRW